MDTEVEGWLNRNQKRIDDKIAAGAQFIISRSGMVHTLTCHTVRDQLDLRSTFPFDGSMSSEQLREEIRGGGFPLLPNVATEQQLAENPRKRCRTCCPNTPEKQPRPRPTTRAGAVNRSHIGRSVDGREVQWVALTAHNVVLGFTDSTTTPYGVEDRIEFDPRVTSSAIEGESA